MARRATSLIPSSASRYMRSCAMPTIASSPQRWGASGNLSTTYRPGSVRIEGTQPRVDPSILAVQRGEVVARLATTRSPCELEAPSLHVGKTDGPARRADDDSKTTVSASRPLLILENADRALRAPPLSAPASTALG